MNPKALKRVTIALGVVLFLWLASEFLGSGMADSETALVLPALSADSVDVVTITKTSDTATLVRSGTAWTVNGFKASEDAIDELFSALSDSSQGELVATSELVHERMDVDSSSGKLITFARGGETLAALVFGKRGRQFNTAYVRHVDEPFVYQYSGPLGRLVDRSVSDWRDKSILRVEPDSVSRINAVRDGDPYTLVRRNDQWQFETGVRTDSAAVRRLLNQYRDLESNGFATEAQIDSADFDSPDREVRLFGLAGDTLVSLVMDSTSGAFWVRRAEGGTVYRVLIWKVNQMIPVDSTLREKEAS